MSLIACVAGPYNATFNAVSLGAATGTGTTSLTTDGYTITQDMKAELVQQTDQYGDSIIDGIYRGGNCFVDAESKTFIQGSTTPFWPQGGTLAAGGGTPLLGTMLNVAVPMGTQLSTLAAALVLAAVTNTPARGTSPSVNTLTANSAVLPPDSNLKLLFTSKLRTVPIRLMLLPYATGSGGSASVTWFTTA